MQLGCEDERNRMGLLRLPMNGRMEQTDEMNSVTYCPFNVLLDMIEGRRPRGSSSQTTYSSHCRHGLQPTWSVSPFFQLYMRYLAEFSTAVQMLAKMRRSPHLKRNLKVLSPFGR